MKQPIDLDQRYNPVIFTYEKGDGHKQLMLQGLSPEYKGNYSISMDTRASRNQTIVLDQGVEWEIVLELRPRRLTEIEKAKLHRTGTV